MRSLLELYQQIQSPLTEATLEEIVKQYSRSVLSMYEVLMQYEDSSHVDVPNLPELINAYGGSNYHDCVWFQHGHKDIEQRLYLNCPIENSTSWAKDFVSECHKRDIPFDMKIWTSSPARRDRIVIYTDNAHLLDCINLLQDIAQRHPDWAKSEPPILTGKVNWFIGIGDEPTANGTKINSYNGLRCDILDKAIKETIRKSIARMKETILADDKLCGGFFSIVSNSLGHDIKTDSVLYEHMFNKNYGAKIEDIDFEKLPRQIFDSICNNRMVMNAYFERLIKYPEQPLNIHVGKLKINIMEKSYKVTQRFSETLATIDKEFIPTLKAKTLSACQAEGIDVEKFCFSKGTKELFEDIDKNTRTPIKTIQANIDETLKTTPPTGAGGNVGGSGLFGRR